jgi:hypothetical protein
MGRLDFSNFDYEKYRAEVDARTMFYLNRIRVEIDAEAEELRQEMRAQGQEFGIMPKPIKMEPMDPEPVIPQVKQGKWEVSPSPLTSTSK